MPSSGLVWRIRDEVIRAMSLAAVGMVSFAGIGLARELNRFVYDSSEPVVTVGAAHGRGFTLTVEELERGGYRAEYEWKEGVTEALEDIAVLSYKRETAMTSEAGGEFFAGVAAAGLWELPKSGDKFYEKNTEVMAALEGRDVQHHYDVTSEKGPPRALHEFVQAFAKQQGIDGPQDRAKATRVIEGDRTPARHVALSALLMNPARYDGKRIAAIGFYHSEYEASLFMPVKFPPHAMQYERTIWLGDYSQFAEESEVGMRNDARLRVEGVFQADAHYRVGQIGRITKVDILSDAPLPGDVPPLGEDDPHGMDQLSDEITIAPFPIDGRPVQEVVAGLNKQIAAQLTDRGLPSDWLRIEVDPASNGRTRLEADIRQPLRLREFLQRFGIRLWFFNQHPTFREDRLWYTYVLPDVIRVQQNASDYADDEEPISWHKDNLEGHPVRVKIRRFAGRDGDAATFGSEWQLATKPAKIPVAAAMRSFRRLLPEGPGAKAIASILLFRDEETWTWTMKTGSPPEPRPTGNISMLAGQLYLTTWDAEAVKASPAWSIGDEPPLEIGAAQESALRVLRKLPGAEERVQLQQVELSQMDKEHGAYAFRFSGGEKNHRDFVVVTVLLSGQALEIIPDGQ